MQLAHRLGSIEDIELALKVQKHEIHAETSLRPQNYAGKWKKERIDPQDPIRVIDDIDGVGLAQLTAERSRE